MGIFNKNQSKLPEFLREDEPNIESPVNYNSVLDYLVGLAEEDHDKIFKVSKIYREANKKASEVLGIDDEPTTSILESETSPALVVEGTIEDNFLDEPDFLEDEPKKPKAKK